MPNVLAMSFEGELAPAFRLLCLEAGRPLPDGWGLGYYPGGEPSASVLKEPAPAQDSIRGQLARSWEHLESSLFVVHIRSATWGAITDANTQPFVRSWGRRDWMMAHAGSLDRKLESEERGLFEPVGSTDTEQIFCSVMNRLAERGWRSFADADLDVVLGWLTAINAGGELSVCLSDGRDLLAYADQRGTPLWLGTLAPPYEHIQFGDDDLAIDLTQRGAKARKGVIICSSQLIGNNADDGDAGKAMHWRALQPGELVLIRQGALVAERLAPPIDMSSVQQQFAPSTPTRAGTSSSPPPMSGSMQPPQLAQSPLSPLVVGRARSQTMGSFGVPHTPRLPRPTRAEVRYYDIIHRTVYNYTKAIERSGHVLRCTPRHDRLQELINHELTVSVPCQARDYDDVFGNRVRRLQIETPYTEMIIQAKTRIALFDVDPLDFRPLRARSTIPLVWMPWQRQVLEPFLLPAELPESELAELAEYAMSFVKRNEGDLLDTLLDINSTIFREYQYQQGATTVLTSAFDVYVNRRGVCQDFTNLFICLARLLGVPARYVCGYIYTGPKNPNQVQSEASHAWVQVYLPEAGWKGFDPTNGILTQTDHVRVAVGRNYLDATPTSGTIYVGGGGESLTVDVKVEPVDGNS